MLKEALSDAIPRISVWTMREAVGMVQFLWTCLHRLNKHKTCVGFPKNNRSPGVTQTIRRRKNIEIGNT